MQQSRKGMSGRKPQAMLENNIAMKTWKQYELIAYAISNQLPNLVYF